MILSRSIMSAPLEFVRPVLVSVCWMLSRGLHQVHKLLVRSGKLIVAIAATWAVAASLYIFFSPVSMHGQLWRLSPESNPGMKPVVSGAFCGLFFSVDFISWQFGQPGEATT
jgi:lysylphosphatidylglycerol synthetase-like protein (DUF2156 family)